jgi:putative oxidoreductase
MLSDSHRRLIQTKGVVIGRILLGFMFFWSGVGILFGGVGNTAGYYDSLGIPLPMIMAILVVTLKIGAGGALMIGKCVGKAAAALGAFTLLATIIAHADIADQNLYKNLAIIGGFLYVMAFGAGKWNGGTVPESNPQSTEGNSQ